MGQFWPNFCIEHDISSDGHLLVVVITTSYVVKYL